MTTVSIQPLPAIDPSSLTPELQHVLARNAVVIQRLEALIGELRRENMALRKRNTMLEPKT